MSGGANLSSAAVFNPGSIHASRAYVDAVLSGEAGNRSAADDALTIAIQDVDTKLSVHAAGSSHVTQQEKSAWNSKCPLEDGKVPAANLPSFVDDVVEAGDSTLFPRTGETGKIYVARDTNKTYRWGGSGYVEISQSLALGETSSTAYPGNKGKANAEAIASEASRAHGVEELILQAISEFLKDASVSQDGKTLTITKKDGTTVQFQGGSSAWDDITGKPQSFTPEEHTHDYVPLVADVEGNKAAVTVGTRGDATVGSSSVVNGNYCFAVGNYSHAEGNGTTAGGEYSHAEGSLTTAGGDCSHAEGEMTNASGDHSHAEGEGTTASGDYSHAEGAFSTAKDQVSYTFSGDDSRDNNPYESHGNGTFNINPLPQGEGETDPASGFFVGETSLKEMIGAKANTDQLPYSSTSTPADRTCATVTVASTGASVTIPKPSTANKVTAFCVYLDMTALEGTAPSIGFKYPLGEGETEAQDADILTRGGDGLSYETGAVNAVFFIQCGTKYIASAHVYK